MGRIENLIPHQYKPGQSGNPNGRPKDHLSARLRSKLLDDDELVNEMISQVIAKAKEGDFKYLEFIFDRIEGKPINTQINIPSDPQDSRLAQLLKDLAAK